MDALADKCYYLERDNKRYRFSVSPKLNKWFSDRSPTIEAAQIRDQVMQEIRKAFATPTIPVMYPHNSGDLPDRPVLTLAVLSPDYAYDDPQTRQFIETLTKQHGASSRTHKNVLLWAVPHDRAKLHDIARAWLTWQTILEEIHSGQSLQQLDQAERDKLGKEVKEKLDKTRRDLRDDVWQTYRHIGLLKPDQTIDLIDLGPANVSAAPSLTERIVQQLQRYDYVVNSVSTSYLARNWSGAAKEWNTKALRDMFFASPKFPRLLQPDTLKQTISQGVNNGLFAYIGAKTDSGDYALFYYQGKPPLHPEDVEISEDTFILSKPAADYYVQHKDRTLDLFTVTPQHTTVKIGERVTFTAQASDTDGNVMDLPVLWESAGNEMVAPGVFLAKEEAGEFTVTARVTHQQQEKTATARVRVLPNEAAPGSPIGEPQARNITQIGWRGNVTGPKWMNFYMKVLSRFASDHRMEIGLHVTIARPEGISPQKIDEMKMALRDLGLSDELEE